MERVKKTAAKAVRVLTVPPVMVAVLILLLGAEDPAIFRGTGEKLLTLFFLGVVPMLAYPLQPAFPKYRGRGREGQRELAFVMTGAGYSLALVGALCTRVGRELLTIVVGYFVSFVLLTLCNNATPIHASGHASSIAGPMLYLVRFVGWRMLPPCIALAALVVWSSLTLRRHTAWELLSGAGISVAAFFAALLLCR